MEKLLVKKPGWQRRPDAGKKHDKKAAAHGHPILRLQRSIGNQAVLHMAEPGRVQAKRAVGTAEDGFARKANGLGPGQPLDGETRAFMEPRFGRDFGGVRVHTGDRASESARAVNALAYTKGRDIVFKAGQYAPGTEGGRKLLAHELAHTIQQEHTDMSAIQRQEGGSGNCAPPGTGGTPSKEKTFRCPDFAGDTKLEACLNNRDRLRPGDTGPSVEKVQRHLMEDRISVGPKGNDGFYGDGTSKGVMEFKRKHGLGCENYPDVGPGTMGKLDELCEKRNTIKEARVILKSIAFKSDHGLLKDNQVDWSNSGSRYPKPEWSSGNGGQDSAPISHTMNQPVYADVVCDILPESARDIPLVLKGESGYTFLYFEYQGLAHGGRGQTFSMVSAGNTPGEVNLYPEVGDKGADIDWLAEIDGAARPIGKSTGHQVFVTLDFPARSGDPVGTMTHRRIAKAVELTRGKGNKPQTIIVELMKLFRHYSEYPYNNNPWPLADAIWDSAQCQAIVRFVRAIIEMIGIPGAISLVVYTSPYRPDFALLGYLHDEGYSDVGAGMFVDPSTGYVSLLFDAGGESNNYEAALYYNGIYYPGGVGGYSAGTANEVLYYSFKEMDWVNKSTRERKKLIKCYKEPCLEI